MRLENIVLSIGFYRDNWCEAQIRMRETGNCIFTGCNIRKVPSVLNHLWSAFQNSSAERLLPPQHLH